MTMKTCSYKILSNGEVVATYDSYTDLYQRIMDLSASGNTELESMADVVFDRMPERDAQSKKLNDLKKDTSVRMEYKSMHLDDGEPGFDGKISILKFLDSDMAMIEGKRVVTKYDEEALREAQVKKLQEGIKEDGKPIVKYSKEDAEKIVADIAANNDKVSEDGGFIHLMFDSLSFEKTVPEFIKVQRDNHISERLNDDKLLESLHKQINYTYMTSKGKYPKALNVSGLVLKSKIIGTDVDMYGKANWIFVGQDGVLHLYLVKASELPPKAWVKVKTDKYIQQLAILKQMLANNGINVTDMDISIIPVQLTYNDSHTKVTKAIVRQPITYSSSYKGTEYNMARQEAIAQKFVEGSSEPMFVSDDALKRGAQTAKLIFPDVHMTQWGIDRSADEWIKKAPAENYSGVEPLAIKEVNEADYKYKVLIKGTEYHAKDDSDLKRLVEKHISELSTAKSYSVQRIKDAITKSFSIGRPAFDDVPQLRYAAGHLGALFGKYVRGIKDESTGVIHHDWELLDVAEQAGIFVFRNKKENTLDFVSVTSFDLNAQVDLPKGNNILGSYRTNSQFPGLKATYANIDAVRAMAVINEIIPKYKDYTLGTLYVLSTINGMNYQMFDVGEFNGRWFNKILTEVKHENPKAVIPNNFSNAKLVDPMAVLVSEFKRLTSDLTDSKRAALNDVGFDQLLAAQDQIEQQAALEVILDRLDREWGFFNVQKLEEDLKKAEGTDSYRYALLFKLANRAYNQLRGAHVTIENSYATLRNKFLTTTTVASSNLRIISENMQIVNDKIADEFYKEYFPNVRKPFNEFYKSVGYTALENMTLGDQVRTFKNLYEYNPTTGENTFVFKNPYDMSNNLNAAERKLLKHVLFQLTRINTNGNFDIAESNDDAIKRYIETHPEYLWVPLEKASSASTIFNVDSWKAKLKNTFKRLRNYFSNFDYFYQDMLDFEREAYGGEKPEEKNFYELHLRNPFSASMPNATNVNDVARKRQEIINKYGAAFFETNLENLLIDVLAQQITTTQYNKLVVSSKALMLEMRLASRYSGTDDVIGKEIKWIQDFLKQNVFRVSIMSDTERKIAGVVSPVKSLVTRILLMGNLVSDVRDIIQGTQQNFIRTVIKLGTDIDPSNLAKAYQYVYTHQNGNAMASNLLSTLCFVYRLSNMDVGRVRERARSGRNGAANWSNWGFATLRHPDFINRMTLFVARCIQDGVMDISATGNLKDSALSLDSDGQLVYDWKKDKRFKAYAENSSNKEEYNKAKSLYLSQVLMYN